MEAGTLVIAVVGLVISATLGIIKVWETFLSKSKFHVSFDWIDRQNQTLELRIWIANLGHRVDSVRNLSTETGEGARWQRDDLRDALPVVLAPGEVKSFGTEIELDREDNPQRAMQDGDADLVVIDARGKEEKFAIPEATEAWTGRMSISPRARA